MTGTERNVIRPLEVPAWQNAETETPAEAPELNAPAPSAARLSIEDFLAVGSKLPRVAQGPKPEGPAPAVQIAARPAAKGDGLESCVHCGAKLSALDLKFNRCMGCGKPPLQVAQDNSAEAWTVRL